MKLWIALPQPLTTLLLYQPNYEFLDKEVEKRKMALQEAKLKAKGLNPDGTPALSALGGFSPASKPCKFVFWTETCVILFDKSCKSVSQGVKKMLGLLLELLSNLGFLTEPRQFFLNHKFKKVSIPWNSSLEGNGALYSILPHEWFINNMHPWDNYVMKICWL